MLQGEDHLMLLYPPPAIFSGGMEGEGGRI